MQSRIVKRNRMCVCVSEASSQLSCVLEAVDAATAVDTYQRLSHDHSLINYFTYVPGIHCHYLLVLVINYLTMLALTSTSMHSALID